MSLRSIRQLDYLILPCRDLAAARAFYMHVLKLPLVEDSGQWVRFKLGATFLTLRPRGRWLSWEDGEIPERSAGLQLAFKVACEEVDACHRELVESGAEIVEAPVDQDFGHRTLFFRDPEGNVLEIYAELD